MDQQEQQLIDRIKQAQNVLVTVSTNPSVDQLAAAIGLTLALNKLDKHGTAVFSGQIPSTIEFLKPEDTLEKNTDSLRDFIIALDKSKADKLRYKVEDQVVRIFITPYRTSLGEKDLDFSQGDFNVDVVVALGVSQQQDIDAAITAHGRILHDATVAGVSVGGQSDLGTINWVDASASSLSEMMLGLIDGIDKSLLDKQIATALLTGIVAGTDRFRNEKTSPNSMTVSAELMAAGANQQLIATSLEAPLVSRPAPEPISDSSSQPPAAIPEAAEPGMLEIHHDGEVSSEGVRAPKSPTAPVIESPQEPKPKNPQIRVDENGMLITEPENAPTIKDVHGVESGEAFGESSISEVRRGRMTEPPSMGGTNLTANTSPEHYDPPTEELTLPATNAPLLSHNESVLPPAAPQPKLGDNPFIPQAPMGPIPAPSLSSPVPALTPSATLSPAPPVSAALFAPPAVSPSPMLPVSSQPASEPPSASPAPEPSVSPPVTPDETLSQIEQSVHSSHLQGGQQAIAAPASNLDDARSAVQAALNGAGAPTTPQPIAALNAQPLGPDLHIPPQPAPGGMPANATLDVPSPANPFGPGQQANPGLPTPPGAPTAVPSGLPGLTQSGGIGTDSAPPVPPPFVPPRS